MANPWNSLLDRFLSYRESGDPAVTTELFEQLTDVLTAYFRSKVTRNEDVSDLVQDALLKIHVNRLAYKTEYSLRTWIFTIASRILIDYWRSRGRTTQRISDGVSPDDLGYVERFSQNVADRDECEHLLGHLSERDRDLLRVYAVEDLAVRDLAELRGSTEGAMKVRLHRIYKSLRKVSGNVGLLFWVLIGGGTVVQPDGGSNRISEGHNSSTEGLL